MSTQVLMYLGSLRSVGAGQEEVQFRPGMFSQISGDINIWGQL